eukprot:GILI01024533.1.p3 GENE.GILI01024533.1~~GILI01024533.1.p3  ORF type:complete len:107 (+),score=38.46 GILI01024533.1:868-1188(+)
MCGLCGFVVFATSYVGPFACVYLLPMVTGIYSSTVIILQLNQNIRLSGSSMLLHAYFPLLLFLHLMAKTFQMAVDAKGKPPSPDEIELAQPLPHASPALSHRNSHH